ncbi:MAG: FHA domain-containing protein [Deltaproteobacteria bacterium]|nr:FHA domain-containing protein [Deltaproteobacteria bacterium]
MTASAPDPSVRWQPLLVVVDTANVSPEILDRIKTNVTSVVKRQFDSGSQLVIVADQFGNLFELKKSETAMSNLNDFMARWAPVEPDKKLKFIPSEVITSVDRGLSALLVPRGRPWALVYSSLCVDGEAKAGDFSRFKGPISFLTWDSGVDGSCVANRDKWLAASKGENVTALQIDKAEQKDALNKALLGPEVDDARIKLSGWEYNGGNFNISVGFDGEAEPWRGSFTEEVVPQSWLDDAAKRRQGRSKMLAAGGLAVLVAILLMVALAKARSGAAEVAKWEAVGEAEDLSVEMDPDAWNATIFQLTGAMPVLKDIKASAAQLGPAKKADPATRQQTPEELMGQSVPKPAKLATPDGTKETVPAPGGKPGGKKTGMTVAMPVLDDGTAYEAQKPFEVGVLLSGKPVARKTKKFRKVFSIGRATDNRVVIQKDDTVHRYHVVIRPALEGKEWWLEVSPTASNRTNLNGKDLRAGGRYRLPARFRLQLGEATEVRGRLTD